VTADTAGGSPDSEAASEDDESDGRDAPAEEEKPDSVSLREFLAEESAGDDADDTPSASDDVPNASDDTRTAISTPRPQTIGPESTPKAT